MSASLKVAALRHLARREHSRAELRQKLAPHADTPEQLDALLDDLATRNLLSDSRFANSRVQSRSARLGNSRLSQELRQRGVADDEITQALAGCRDEVTRCQQVWAKKFGTRPDSREAAARQQRFLCYRGFSLASIQAVWRQASEAKTAENGAEGPDTDTDFADPSGNDG